MSTPGIDNEPRSGPVAITRLKNRPEFLFVADGGRVSSRGFSLQFRARPGGNANNTARLGFTVTKKVGIAVVRNRVRRRLKAAAELVFPELAQPATDYVLVGRLDAMTLPFPSLIADLKQALARSRKGETRALRAPRPPLPRPRAKGT